jgi:hypothetical protein
MVPHRGSRLRRPPSLSPQVASAGLLGRSLGHSARLGLIRLATRVLSLLVLMTYPTKEHALPSDPHSFDEIKLPFIFVPHGEPEPTEWLARHPDNIKLPATFVPHARSDRRSAPSSGGPPLGQYRTIDGLAAPPDPTAQPQAGNGMSSEMSAAANQTTDHAAGSNDPVAAFRRANEGLATAASDHTAGRAGGSDPYGCGFNAAPNLSGAPGQSPVQDDHAAPGLLERLNPISAAHAQSLTPAKADLLWDELRGGGHTLEKHVGKTQAWLDKSIEPGVMVEGSVDLSKLR